MKKSESSLFVFSIALVWLVPVFMYLYFRASYSWLVIVVSSVWLILFLFVRNVLRRNPYPLHYGVMVWLMPVCSIAAVLYDVSQWSSSNFRVF